MQPSRPGRLLVLSGAALAALAFAAPLQGQRSSTRVHRVVKPAEGVEFDVPLSWTVAPDEALAEINASVPRQGLGDVAAHCTAALLAPAPPGQPATAFVLVSWEPDADADVDKLLELHDDTLEDHADSVEPFSARTKCLAFRLRVGDDPAAPAQHLHTVGRLTRTGVLYLSGYSDEAQQPVRDAGLSSMLESLRVDPAIEYEVSLSERVAINRGGFVGRMGVVCALLLGSYWVLDRLSRRSRAS